MAAPFIPLCGAEITVSLSLSGNARVTVLLLVPLSTFLAAVTGSAYALIEAKRTYARDFRVASRAHPEAVHKPVRLPTKRALRFRLWLSALVEASATAATVISVVTSDVSRGDGVVDLLAALIAVVFAQVVSSYPSRTARSQ
jgi:hypothetical protein